MGPSESMRSNEQSYICKVTYTKLQIQGILMHKQIYISKYFFTIMVVVLDVVFKILCMGWAAGVAPKKSGQELPSPRHRPFQTAPKNHKAQPSPTGKMMVPWRKHI